MSRIVQSRYAKAIDDYIAENGDCRLKKEERYMLRGDVHRLPVYRLPLKLLLFNIRNGRFAAELREKEQSLSFKLDPENGEHAKIIAQLLLKDKKEAGFLLRDLKEVGQKRAGAISHDGRIINGNRRVAVLTQLMNEEGPQYGFFETVRLPSNLDPKDLWRIEAGIQLGHEFQVNYGPVNELLKIKEGREAKLSLPVIAKTLGGDNTVKTVEEKLDRLELIETYLRHLGTPFKYSEAEGKVEHFIDLQKILRSRAYRNLTKPQQSRFIKIAFDFIRSGMAHLRIRKLQRVLVHPQSLDVLERAHKEALRALGKSAPGTASTEEIGDEGESIARALAGQRKAAARDPRGAKRQRGHGLGPKADAKAERLRSGEAREEFVDALDGAMEVAAARDVKGKPRKLVRRAETAVQALSQLERLQLKPFKGHLDRLASELRRLSKKARS